MVLKTIAKYIGRGRSPKKVLVVDDGASSLRGVADELKVGGYQIGFDGSCSDYDLVLVDVDVDGRADFLKRTRDANRDIPIVAVMEQVDAKIFKTFKDGADYCLTRPVEPKHALNVVNYLIGDLTEEEKERLERVL